MNPRTLNSPRFRLAMSELPRAAVELGSLLTSAPLLTLAPRGDGHTVLVMPGFAAGDTSTVILRQYLTLQGYNAEPWELGNNLGPGMPNLRHRLAHRLEELWQAADQQAVSLVGWSLGGVYARLLAHLYPDRIRSLVTLGSPIGRSGIATPGRAIRDPLPADIPSAAVFSKTDAVVPWHQAVQQAGPRAENIEVFSSHIGLGISPTVLYATADRLAQPSENWRSFRRDGWKLFAYGAARLEDTHAQPGAA